MTEEPYRWLEAINNRREYVADQLRGSTPVFAVSRPEGILLLGLGAAPGSGPAKVFEIYNRHALAAFGHPVDIERLRQMAIESTHLEGFQRSPEDVTLRRLVSFVLGPRLKAAFEQIFSPPLLAESLLAEIGPEPSADLVLRLRHDGGHVPATQGIGVAALDPAHESAAAAWLQRNIGKKDPLRRVAALCLHAWKTLVASDPDPAVAFASLEPPASYDLTSPEDKIIEMALLDRHSKRKATYRPVVTL